MVTSGIAVWRHANRRLLEAGLPAKVIMKLFKNKFFLICLCVAVVLSVMATTFSLMGYRALVRDAVGTVTYPFRWFGNKVADAGEGFAAYFGSVKALRRQNEALEEENQSLRQENEEAKLLEEENRRLREYLNLHAKSPKMQLQDATVVGREANNYNTIYLLNRGSIHKIEIGMPVITETGLVGSVCEVGLSWCKVTTLLETNEAVGAEIPAREAAGIVSGEYALQGTGLCKLSYTSPADANLQQGDLVYSSGTGSTYPAGLLIGRIAEVVFDTPSRSVAAYIRPAVEYENLTHVMVITGYN